MSIQELGSIGELVGAIAVLMTLIYLSLQTRRSRVAAEETAKFAQIQASHAALDVYARWRELFLSDAAQAEILSDIAKGETPTDAEWSRTKFLFQDLFFSASFSHFDSSVSASFHDQSADVDYILGVIQDFPCLIEIWNEIKGTVGLVGSDFVKVLDQRLQSTEV